jgi:hypothetical protein
MTGVVAWSTLGGLVVGVIADMLLIGVGAIAVAILPNLPRSRWLAVATITLLVLVPLVAGYLGLIEGRLKTETSEVPLSPKSVVRQPRSDVNA